MKRGTSGLSLIVGVDKPAGMSSHDVVNRVRKIFGERRVGHTGTLDPLATGVLLVAIGPAARLDAFFEHHDKTYRVRVAFGVGTDTDDAQGNVTSRADVPDQLLDESFARARVAALVGRSKQLPPVYSALKVNGKKACDEARAGRVIDLKPRDIEVYRAELVGLGVAEEGEGCEGCVFWDIELHVSKGTYIRSIARDLGLSLSCPAHVAALRRLSAGRLSIADCVTLETLEDIGVRAALDPIDLLGFRFVYAQGALAEKVSHGSSIAMRDIELCEKRYPDLASRLCACTSGVQRSCAAAADGEMVAVVVDNKLAALYTYDGAKRALRARCVFQTGVSRGEGI